MRFRLSLFFMMFALASFRNHAVAQPQNCSDYVFSGKNLRFAACSSLPVLNSFLHWNYHAANNTVEVAYRHTGVTATNWVVWSLNLGSRRMVGAQCLVAFQNSSGIVHAFTSPISSYSTRMQEGPLSFDVPRIGAEFLNNEMIIYATIQLPAGRTSFTHVWQHGDVSGGDTLQEHSTRGANMRSYGSIDFANGNNIGGSGGSSSSGESREDDGEESSEHDKNVHGVLNVVSWGIMMPLGAMMARYLKVFKAANPAWFYLHVTFQMSAYIVGVAGLGTGLKLEGEEDTHKNIGITLVTLGTLQAFALLLRPKPDHKYRFYWNLYHWGTGYAVVVLSIINIFEGLEILDVEQKWRTAYIWVLIFFGVCVAILEPFTWYVVLKRKKRQQQTTKHRPIIGMHNNNGSISNGINGTYNYSEVDA